MSSHLHSINDKHTHQPLFSQDKIRHRRFLVGIIVNIIFIFIEVFYAWEANAGVLIAEAFHHFSDVLSISFSWLATIFAHITYKEGFTYGYRRANILLGVFNVVLLFLVGLRLIYEGLEGLFENKHVDGETIIQLAILGIGVNYFTAWLFRKGREKDINIQNTYFHFMLDAMVTLGVVIAGGIIWWTKWYWLDGFVTCLVAIVIMYNARNVFYDAFLLLLDAVPSSLNIREISDFLANYQKVQEVKDLRVWGISTTENALTAHIFVSENVPAEFVLQFQAAIKNHFNIAHVTLQVQVGEEGAKKACNHSH